MKTVLITGATSGIGKEFTNIYAKRNYNLVLVSRDILKLENIKTELTTKYNISIEIFAIDLSKHNSGKELINLLEDIDIDILINNAGVGLYGKFIDSDIDKINSMLSLNISSLVELTYHLANKMVQKRQGKILNIASMAAFQPIPNFSVYAASKTFVLNFTEALNFELKPYGVTASVLCPGATATNFDKAAGASDTKLFKSGVMNATDVAKIGVKQLDNNQMTKVAGYKNKILSILSSTNPFRRLSVKIADFIVN